VAQASGAGNLPALNGSFRRTLRAEDKSERTVKSYTEAVTLFADFLAERGHPLTVNAITRDDVRAFIADQLERWKPLTALNRYRGLQAFFKWALAGGELGASPMAGMNPPQIPDEPPPVLTDDELRRLLKACEGRDFPDRRDAADDQVVIVLGKGRRTRAVPFGRKTALALDRYLRLRASHPFSHLPNL
jgi:site-specific recombinase XerC